MAISPSILKQTTRIIRDFLWQGRRDAKAGCCLVSWPKVCWPIRLGGLGVCDIHRSGIALRVRRLWLKATDPLRWWRHLHLPCEPEIKAFFRASTT